MTKLMLGLVTIRQCSKSGTRLTLLAISSLQLPHLYSLVKTLIARG
jgi:hypothetical protein